MNRDGLIARTKKKIPACSGNEFFIKNGKKCSKIGEISIWLSKETEYITQPTPEIAVTEFQFIKTGTDIELFGDRWWKNRDLFMTQHQIISLDMLTNRIFPLRINDHLRGLCKFDNRKQFFFFKIGCHHIWNKDHTTLRLVLPDHSYQ